MEKVIYVNRKREKGIVPTNQITSAVSAAATTNTMTLHFGAGCVDLLQSMYGRHCERPPWRHRRSVCVISNVASHSLPGSTINPKNQQLFDERR